MTNDTIYKTYTHFSSKETKLDDLISADGSKISGWNVGDLVGYEDENGILNLERIYKRYEWDDYEVSKADFDSVVSSDLAALKSMQPDDRSSFSPSYDIIKSGTVILIPVNRFHSDVTLADIPPAVDEREMFHSELLELMKAEVTNKSGIEGLAVINPVVTVLIWSRSSGTESIREGKLINFTPMIMSVNTTKQAVNGSLALSIAPSNGQDDVLFLYGIGGSQAERREWVSKTVGVGDIVFVKFGHLDGVKTNEVAEVSPTVITKNSFDMVAIVSSRPKSIGSSSLKLSVNASDLTALLSKDNSAIYSQMIISDGSESGLVNFDGGLTRFQGKYISQFSFKRQSIETNLRFIMDYQSRMTIDSDLFDVYEDRYKLELPELNLSRAKAIGVWKSIDVFVDKSVSGLRLYNSEIGNSNETLMAQMSKVCSEHFAEFRTDYYGSKFYIMARKPLFDRAAVMDAKESDMTMWIPKSRVLSIDLQQTQESYSWYKVEYDMLTALFKDEKLEWLMPAVHFGAYGDMFGDKPLIAKNQYMSLEVKSDNLDDGKKKSSLAFTVINDLKFLIESNAYLPFTLSGSIRISGVVGIRSGTWVFYDGLIMYVDSVSKSVSSVGSLSAFSTLSVSRVMYSDSIEEYFSVISLEVDKPNGSDDFLKYIKRTLSSWRVNEDVFQRLIERRNKRG